MKMAMYLEEADLMIRSDHKLPQEIPFSTTENTKV